MSARLGCGSPGTDAFGAAAKLKALVRSPVTERRQGVRLGTSVPRRLTSDCPENAPDTGDESFPTVTGYTLPAQPQKMPGQEPGKPRRPSGLTC